MPSSTVLYVSPLGNDSWSGRLADPDASRGDGPLATLGRARDLLRQRRGPGRATVRLRGGLYPMPEPLILEPRDSGRPRAPVVYEACRDETPVLDCGRAITGWRPCDDLDGWPARARGHIWQARVPKGWSFARLYWNGRDLPRSRTVWSDEWERWPRAPLDRGLRSLRCDPAHLPAGDRGASAVLNFLPTPYTFWSNALVPVRRLDAKCGRIAFAPVQFHRPEVLKQIPFRLENLAAGLQRPGQWYVDHRRGCVYLWPPGDESPEEAFISAPWLSSAIALRGGSGTGGSENPVRHVVLRGLTVVRTALENVDWSAPRSAFGAPGAALTLHHAESCRIESCHIRQGSANAISGSGTVRRCTVSNCHITGMGGGGISLAGGLCDPEPPVTGNRLTGNHIHHCGALYWHSSGIAAGLSDRTLVAGNHIHDMPYVGISTGGFRHRWFAGWPRVMDELIDFWKRRGAGAPTILAVKEHLPGYNRIEDNRVERVMLQLDDGAAIYCHAGHHNAVRRNVVVGTPRDGSHGLYFDDEECFSLMEHNVVVGCPDRRHTRRGSALHLHNNAGNTVRQNIFVGADVLFTCPNSYGGHRIEENVFLFSDRCRLRSHPAPVMGPGDGRRQDGWVLGPSVMDGNLYWSARGSGPAEGLVRRLRELGFEAGAVVADPRLEVGDDGQWSLGVGSPVRDLIGELERLPDVG